MSNVCLTCWSAGIVCEAVVRQTGALPWNNGENCEFLVVFANG